MEVRGCHPAEAIANPVLEPVLGERRVDFVELEDFAAACGKGLGYFRTAAKS